MEDNVMALKPGEPPVEATPEAALPSGDGSPAPDPSSITGPTLMPTLSEVVDSLEREAGEYATWEDLCEPGGRQRDYILRNGKRVRYTTFVPLEKVAQIRLKAMVGGRFDNARFVSLLLKEVMVRPRIDSDEQLRMALKADGMALLDVVSEVQNLNRALREAQEESLGES